MQVGTLLLSLNVTGGSFACRLLTEEDNPFFLSPYGEFHTASVLDREDTDSYQLPVTCRGESRSLPYLYALIYVSVADVADSPPLIDPSFQVSFDESSTYMSWPFLFTFPEKQSYPTSQVTVPENQTLHEPFFALPAYSPDLAAIVFSMAAGNSAGMFSIASDTGILSLELSLDYETRQAHQLILQASSGGIPGIVNYSTVIVMVEDVLEPPEFSQSSYEFVVSKSPVDGLIGCVLARDGQGQSVTYSIDVSEARRYERWK